MPIFPSTTVDELTLDNGLKILACPHGEEELVSVQIWVRTGSIHEDEHLGKGLSHFVEHMIFKGTHKRHYSTIAQEVQALGGEINAYTSFDRTVYYIEGPSEATNTFLEILHDIVFHSTFPEDEFPKEKDVILREIDMVLDDPDRKLSQATFETVYRQAPQKYPVIGYRDLFKSISRDDLWNYYQERYIPNNSFVVVTGKIDSAAIFNEVTTLFSPLPRQAFELPILRPEPTQILTRTTTVIDEDAQVLRGAVAFPVPGTLHEDAIALRMLAMIFAQGESSILYHRLHRELQLVHYIQGVCWNPGEHGIFWIQFGCDIGKEEAVIKVIHEEAARLAKNNELGQLLEKVIKQAQVRDLNSFKTVGGMAGKIAMSEFMIGQQGLSNLMLEQMSATSVADIQRVTKAYLIDKPYNIITLQPSKEKKTSQMAKSSAKNAVSTHLLSNGIRVCLLPERSLPKTHIRGITLGGSQLDPLAQSGVGSLSINLLNKDTLVHTAAEIAERVERAGAVFEESVGKNTLGLTLESLSEDLDDLLPLLANGFLAPAFSPETFRRERDSQVAQIKEELDEIFDFGQRRLRQLLFPEHPLGNDSYGTIETLEKLTVGDCQSFAQQITKAGNFVLSVCGDFDSSKMLNQLENLFKDFPAGEQVNTFLPAPAIQASTEHLHMDREQSVVFCAFPEQGVLSLDYETGELLDEIFSGMSSRLFETIREERGLAYYVGTSRTRALQASAFIFYAGTHPDKAQEVLTCIWEEIQRAKNGGILEKELQAAKQRMIIRGRKARQSIGAYAAQMGLNTLYGLPVDHWKTTEERLAKISLRDLQAFANKYFDASSCIQLTVGKS